MDDRKRVIFARYGSLDNYDNIQASLLDISRRLRIPVTTIHKLLHAFARRGNRIEAFGRRY